MRACECVARVLHVIELGIEPGIDRVAALARCRKARRHVIQHRCLEILLVARVATRR